MLGVIVNSAAVIVGTLAGLLLKKGLPEKIVNAVMQVIGLSVLYIGITGLSSAANSLVVIISLVIGTALGTLADIDGHLDLFSKKLETLVSKNGSKNPVGEGFMTASLIYCIGSMAIMGSLTAGLTGDNSVLFTKSLLDGITSIMLASSLGWGVMLSAFPLFLYQGIIALLAGVLYPVLEPAISDLVCTGSIIIIGLSLNLIGITKIKIANLLPAIFLSPVIFWIASLI